MTTLDMLANDSASAIRLSVASVRAPVAGIAPALRAAAIWRGIGYSFGGATAGVAVVFALVVLSPTLDDPAQQVPTTSAVVPTTIVAPEVVPVTLPDAQAPEPGNLSPVVVAQEESTSTETAAPDTTPPPIEVLSPNDGDRFETKSLTFTGSSEAGATVVASGKFPAKVDADGFWSIALVLSPGANGVVFTATDAAGNESLVRMIVHLDVEVETTTTTTTKPASWEFTANQKFGSCEEPVAYDVFFGKGKPGTTVNVLSPYGSGSAVVNKDGSWDVKVFFPSAPYNVSFTVKVKDFAGTKKTFSFVSLYQP